MAFHEGERLVEREAELAGDHVDVAGQQVGLQRRGLLDGEDGDAVEVGPLAPPGLIALQHQARAGHRLDDAVGPEVEAAIGRVGVRSEEHTSELQSLMRISYAVFCLKKKNQS